MADVQALTADETLSAGDSGPQVEEAQRRLWHLGHYQGGIDGYYGDATATAVERFRQEAGVLEDGDLGALTWERLEFDAEAAGYDKYADYSAEPAGDAAGSAGDDTEDQADAGNRHWDGARWLEWDGSAWVPMDDAAADAGQPEQAEQLSGQVGQLSEDGQWRWDGTTWVAAEPAEAAAELAEEPIVAAADGEPEAAPWAREVMDEIDSPDTEAAPVPSVTA